MNDQYQLGVMLGHGSFGEVFKCIRKHTNQQFAMKIIRKDTVKHPTMQKLMT
jgi:serine/threonine protein kinase